MRTQRPCSPAARSQTGSGHWRSEDLPAEFCSFQDRTCVELPTDQSALSHAIRRLEERLGLRLLTRTTRSVSTTEAGDRHLSEVGARCEEIGAALDALGERRERPAGTIRISAENRRRGTSDDRRMARGEAYGHGVVRIVGLVVLGPGRCSYRGLLRIP
ncbi:LysR family transcriptional regulator [Devosia sp. D6-9]|nr:LysR family transcriptional regulator [Devosia sp. D6-9]